MSLSSYLASFACECPKMESGCRLVADLAELVHLLTKIRQRPELINGLKSIAVGRDSANGIVVGYDRIVIQCHFGNFRAEQQASTKCQRSKGQHQQLPAINSSQIENAYECKCTISQNQKKITD